MNDSPWRSSGGPPQRTTRDEQTSTILALLEEESYPTRELAAFLKLSYQPTLELLRGLEGLGRVRRQGSGHSARWFLVDQREQAERRRRERERWNAEADEAVQRQEQGRVLDEQFASVQAATTLERELARRVRTDDRPTRPAPDVRTVTIDGHVYEAVSIGGAPTLDAVRKLSEHGEPT